MPSKFYLAAPFFNPAQVVLVEAIEDAFIHANIGCFSPRSLDENNGGKGKLTDQAAAQIFRKDVVGMMTTEAILCVMDWKLPEGMEIRQVANENGDRQNIRRVAGPPLNIPDSGTVFEMGFQFARKHLAGIFFTSRAFDPVRVCEEVCPKLGGKLQDEMIAVLDLVRQMSNVMKQIKIVLFTERPPEAPLNLMLTQGADGVIRGIDQLRSFLGTNGEPNWDLLDRWKGGHR